MKPEFDREIDALLRSRAGKASARDAAATPRAASVRGEYVRDGSSDHERTPAYHLDADELAAFAEGALPAAARTRYSAHLADCDDCRRTATRLALAAGVAYESDEREAVVVGAKEKASAAAKPLAPSWRERVAALFAPGSWRYAMPVVALLCVGVIALVVMRRLPDAKTQLAREGDARLKTTGESATPSTASDQNHATVATDQNDEVSTQAQSNAPAANNKSQPEVAQRAEAAGDNGQLRQPVTDTAGAATGAGDVASSNASGGSASVLNRPAPAQPPAAMPAPAAATPAPETQSLAAVSSVQPTPVPSMENRIEVAKDEKAKALDQITAEREQPKARRGRAGGESAAAPATRAPSRAARDEQETGGAAPGGNANASRKETKEAQARASREEARKDDDRPADSTSAKPSAAETRAVAGRRFRREGDAWIDTAYGGGATTVVRRGSEQYRALVADEPEIGRVAASLSGEVVVVWKGRAYRIKP